MTGFELRTSGVGRDRPLCHLPHNHCPEELLFIVHYRFHPFKYLIKIGA